MMVNIPYFLKSLRYGKFALLGEHCSLFGYRLSGRGKIFLGDNVTLKGTEFYAGSGAEIRVGRNSFLGKCGLSALLGITIGDEAIIADLAGLLDSDWHGTKRGQIARTEPIQLGKHVWVCARAVILKGVNIGDNAIIGAGAIVTTDVEANTIVAGNPARTIGETDGYGCRV